MAFDLFTVRLVKYGDWFFYNTIQNVISAQWGTFRILRNPRLQFEMSSLKLGSEQNIFFLYVAFREVLKVISDLLPKRSRHSFFDICRSHFSCEQSFDKRNVHIEVHEQKYSTMTFSNTMTLITMMSR